MTTQQVLEQAQLRVDSFKPYSYNVSIIRSPVVSEEAELDNAKKIAHIAIDTEIADFKDCETVSKIYCATVFKKLIDIQLIKEQINNTI